jgi:hypothetical protein
VGAALELSDLLPGAIRVVEFVNEELNWATRLLLKWLLASDPAAVDALIQKAYESVERDLSLIDGRDICVALQEHLAASVREIISSWLKDFDRFDDDMIEPPRTAGQLHRYLLTFALCSIDLRAAMQELLVQKRKWTPAKIDAEK